MTFVIVLWIQIKVTDFYLLLFFRFKQYTNVNVANFLFYGKNLLVSRFGVLMALCMIGTILYLKSRKIPSSLPNFMKIDGENLQSNTWRENKWLSYFVVRAINASHHRWSIITPDRLPTSYDPIDKQNMIYCYKSNSYHQSFAEQQQQSCFV